MRYRVPQNIDMEDKIIGPLTMAQFLYVMVGGMVIYLAFISFDATILFWLIALPVGLATLALAFLKVQDQPFPKFIASMLLYLVKPKSRIWQKDPNFQHVAVVHKDASTPEEAVHSVALAGDEVANLAGVLDTETQDVRRKTLGDDHQTLASSVSRLTSAQEMSGETTKSSSSQPGPTRNIDVPL